VGWLAGKRERANVIRAAWRNYWRKADWIQELAYLAVLSMEACVVYLWQRLVGGWLGHEGVSLFGVWALTCTAYWIAGLLSSAELREDRRQVAVTIAILASALVMVRVYVYPAYAPWEMGWIGDMANSLFSFTEIPPDLTTILLTFVAWWRGILGSRKALDTPDVWFHFRVSVILVFGYLMLNIFAEIDTTLPLLAFFFCGLISIALARILELGGVRASTLGSKRWMAVLVGSTLGSLGLVLLVTVVFSRRTLRTILGWLQPLRTLIARAAWVVFSAVLYLLWPLLDWALSWLAQVTSEGMEEQIESLPSSPFISPLQIVASTPLERSWPYCRAAIVIVIVVIGLLLVARLIRRIVQAQDEGDNLERESLLSSVDLGQELKRALQERLARLRALVQGGDERHRRSIASVRKLYASMVDLATEVGYGRRQAETPYEYRVSLRQAFPGAEEGIEAITEAYVRTHYGEAPGTQAEMDQLVRYWRQIQGQATPKGAEQL
jgi:hypothetical protein